MNLERFLLISIFVHILIFTGLYLLPEQKKQEMKQMMTRLVSPEELQPAAPVPLPPPVAAPRQVPQPAPRSRRQPALPMPSRITPIPDRPVVPGIGKEGSKPLPEEIVPRGDVDAGKGGGSRPSKSRDDGDFSVKPGYLQKEKLFDRGIIGDAARKKSGQEGVQEGSKEHPITFDTSEYRFAGYMRKLREKVEGVWEYPHAARAKGIYGDLKIRFTIKKDGKLGAVELVRTSGYKMLDDAALRALKDGEPYWPLPDDWGMESYTILGHFVYSLYGYGIQ